jgi:hypothetical protein
MEITVTGTVVRVDGEPKMFLFSDNSVYCIQPTEPVPSADWLAHTDAEEQSQMIRDGYESEDISHTEWLAIADAEEQKCADEDAA